MPYSKTIKSIRTIYEFIKEYHTGFFRGSLTFLDNTLVYLYNKKPSRGPMFVGWNVLFNCNAVCSFCDTHELHKQLDREMTTEEAMSVVRQLGEDGTWHLSLTGGETLLRKDLPQIIKEAKKYGMFVNVNTNGALLAKSRIFGIQFIELQQDSCFCCLCCYAHTDANNEARL